MPVISASASFIDSIRFGSQLVNARCTVYKTGNPTTWTVPVSTCSITVTRNSAYRRQGTLTAVIPSTIPSTPILPINPYSLLAPFGTEIYVELGISPAGRVTTTFWVPMGLFAIATSAVQDTVNNLTVTLTLYDRSWVISQRKLKRPWNLPAVTGNFAREIQHLLNTAWGTTGPPLRYNISPTSAVIPKMSANQGSDPWTLALQMANAIGFELFVNATGIVTAYATPTPTTQPVVWNFTDTPTAVYGSGVGAGSTALLGSPYSTPAEVNVQMTRTGIYNDILVTGTSTYTAPGGGTTATHPTTPGTSSSTAPVLAEAATSTPKSFTSITGGMGDVPEFVSSSLVVGTTQAQQAADNYLRASVYDAWQVTIKQPPMGWLDIDDVVSITRPRVGLNTVKVIIDSLTFTTSYGELESITGRVVP